MAVTDRLAQRILDTPVPLERPAVIDAARRLLRMEAPLAGEEAAVAVADALIGLGPLEPLLRDPTVSDVLVNGPGEVWVERGGVLERTAVEFSGADAVVAAVERVIAPLGLRLDRASPIVDARLPDGSRLHAVVPPAAVGGPIVAIRRFLPAVDSLDQLVASGSITRDGADLLEGAVRERTTILVSGGTGTGKTTLLNVLSRAIPDGERVVTVEDAAELALDGHVIRLEAKPANTEGFGEVTIRTLLRAALRLRPDRIILGEVRGPEALDLITAINTGHRGSLSTVHANSPDEALWRLETLALSGERSLPAKVVRRQLAAAIGLVVQLDRVVGRRRVATIVRQVDGEELYRC